MYCVWNVRGAGKKLFVRIVFDVRAMYSFDVFVILEPRISAARARKIIKKLGFSDHFVVEVKGFAGGIWLLWNSNKIKLEVIASSKQSISTLVDDGSGCWMFTVVYGSLSVNFRRYLWEYYPLVVVALMVLRL
ncbi:hypothetical protein ACOSQ3_010602 [Xanthoceras sorbifolium]